MTLQFCVVRRKSVGTGSFPRPIVVCIRFFQAATIGAEGLQIYFTPKFALPDTAADRNKLFLILAHELRRILRSVA